MFAIYKFFLFRIPFELSLEFHGDIAKVADSDGAVADFNWGGCFTMGLDAVNKVAVMIVALVKADFIWPDHRGFQ